MAAKMQLLGLAVYVKLSLNEGQPRGDRDRMRGRHGRSRRFVGEEDLEIGFE